MADSEKKKGGMVLVISVGGKSPKKPEDTAKPDVKKAIPEASSGKSMFDPLEFTRRDEGDSYSGTHGTYGEGDPTAPFGKPMQGGEPLIEPTSNVSVNPDKDYGSTFSPSTSGENKLYESLDSSSPEVSPSEINMADSMDLGEDMDEPEVKDPFFPERKSLLENMKEKYTPNEDDMPTEENMDYGQEGGSWMSPRGVERLATGQPPKNVFKLSEDPFRFAWQLLKEDLDSRTFEEMAGEFTNPTPPISPSVNTLRENLMAALNSPPTEDEEDPLGAPQNPRPNSPTPMDQEGMVREGGEDLEGRLAQIAAELGRRNEDKPGVTPRSADDNPMFRHLRPELEQMRADTESEIGRRDENRDARRAVRRGV